MATLETWADRAEQVLDRLAAFSPYAVVSYLVLAALLTAPGESGIDPRFIGNVLARLGERQRAAGVADTTCFVVRKSTGEVAGGWYRRAGDDPKAARLRAYNERNTEDR